MKIRHYLISLIALIFLVLPVIAFSATAQSGIQISPLTYNYSINPGGSEEGTITVTNKNATVLNYVIETEDFNQVSDEGAPSFSGTADADTSVTTLKDWITVKTAADKEGTIAAGDSKEITFNVNIPLGAEPGGHYAAIFAKEVKKNAAGQTELGVASRVGTLILVSVPGNVTNGAEITSVNAPGFVWRGPNDFSMKVTNTGTVHYDSKGTATVKSMFGKEAKVDLGTHTIIPKNERSYTGSWTSKYPFGRYTVTFSATDGKGSPVTTDKIIWAIPLIIVIPVLVAIIILIWVIVYLRRHVKFVE